MAIKFKEAVGRLVTRLKQVPKGSDLTNKVLSYSILGNSGRVIQEKIKSKIYSPRNATLVSSATNIPVYAGLAGLAALFTGSDSGTAAGIAASYAGLEGCFRSYASAISGKGTASIPGKILGMPVELATNIYNRMMKKPSKRSTLSPKSQKEQDAILSDLAKVEANPKPRRSTPEQMQSIYARETEKQKRYGAGMLKFMGEAALGAVVGALYEIHPQVADGANATFGMIGLTNFAVSGNKLRTVPALLAGYAAGRVAVKALKYSFDVHSVTLPGELPKPGVPDLDYV